MVHQAFAHQPTAVRQSLREPGRLGIEQQAGRADAVAGHYHHSCPLFLQIALGIIVESAAGPAVPVRKNFPHPAMGFQLRPPAQSLGPIDDVGTGQRSDRTAHIRLPPVILHRGYGIVRGPPVPAQPVKTLGQQLAAHANGQRRRGPFRFGRISRVAAQAGNAVHPVVQVIIGFQFGVGQRPVVSHAVLGFEAEVGGMKAGKVGTPMDGAAAHGVIHQGGNGRFRLPHRIVLRQAAQVGIGVKVGLPMPLGVGFTGVKSIQRHPAALLQADHLDAGLRQAPTESAPGCPGPDDQNIGYVVSVSHSALPVATREFPVIFNRLRNRPFPENKRPFQSGIALFPRQREGRLPYGRVSLVWAGRPYRRSNTAATPWPPPTHIVSKPNWASRRSIS